MSPLNARQRLAYKSSCTIWRPRYDVSSGNKEQVETEYVLVATDVPCMYVNNQSPELPGPFGAYEEVSIFTRDSANFAIDQEIGSKYLIQDTTIDRFGVQSPHYGEYFLCAGTSQRFPALGGRNANFKRVKLVFQPNPPKYILS